MYKKNKIAVIIAAAGSGKRMGSGIPKQYLTIEGIPIIVKTVEAFLNHDWIDTVLVVAGAAHINRCKTELSRFGLDDVQVVEGGPQRQDSVYKGLSAIPEAMDYVLIHDGARPFISQKMIGDVIEAVVEKKAVIAAVPAKDSVVLAQPMNKKRGLDYLDRNGVFIVQTPQGFEKRLLVTAYQAAMQEGFYGTDDGVLVERIGHEVHLVPGDYANIKITTKEDLPMENKVGSGYDVHRLVPNRKLILGGVDIPFEKGLLGHSDADVLAHAIIDALLGAAGLGDIGIHFPDSCEAYKDISSLDLLKIVAEKLATAGCRIGNIDATLICQSPKMLPYIEEMKKNLANALEIDDKAINIKATTTERLGFVGREEGIAAEAVCILYK